MSPRRHPALSTAGGARLPSPLRTGRRSGRVARRAVLDGSTPRVAWAPLSSLRRSCCVCALWWWYTGHQVLDAQLAAWTGDPAPSCRRLSRLLALPAGGVVVDLPTSIRG